MYRFINGVLILRVIHGIYMSVPDSIFNTTVIDGVGKIEDGFCNTSLKFFTIHKRWYGQKLDINDLQIFLIIQ